MARLTLILLLAVVSVWADDRRRLVVTNSRPDWAMAVAKLTWVEKRGRPGFGTAVLVSPRLAMTAAHCAKNWSRPAVLRFGYDGRTQLATRTATKVVARSAAGDWAILLLNEPVAGIAPLKMAGMPIRKCTKEMLLAGYSIDVRRGLVLSYDDGCTLKKIRTDAGRLLTNAICYRGASGGPAFVKDERGRYRWFGIVQGNINVRDPRNIVTYAVYQVVYRRALLDALKRYSG